MTPDAARQFETMALDDFEELLLDKPRDEKWELIGGRVIRGMLGARWEHKEIVLNISTALRNHFRATGSRCRAYDETFWLREKSIDLKVFPDVLVFCRKLTEGATSVHDPVVLFEVLSKGTEQRDRSEKWALYQKLPSLQHYVLVERDKAQVEVFSRPDAEWLDYAMLEGIHGTLKLPAILFEIPLAEIYRDVFL
ncbi:MAG: Uma2 family endonuclease [Hyphomicrobiales bacterium]|nr:Uma2 family endonuclease [Hyphomicrobiales bacterium]